MAAAPRFRGYSRDLGVGEQECGRRCVRPGGGSQAAPHASATPSALRPGRLPAEAQGLGERRSPPPASFPAGHGTPGSKGRPWLPGGTRLLLLRGPPAPPHLHCPQEARGSCPQVRPSPWPPSGWPSTSGALSPPGPSEAHPWGAGRSTTSGQEEALAFQQAGAAPPGPPAAAPCSPARGQTRLSAPRRCGRCGRVGLIDLGRGLCPVCSRRPSSTPVSVHWMPVPPPLVGAQAATRHICRRRRVSRKHGLDPAESRHLFPRHFHSLAPEVGEVLASFCQGQSGTEAFAKEAPGRAGGSWCCWPSPHPPWRPCRRGRAAGSPRSSSRVFRCCPMDGRRFCNTKTLWGHFKKVFSDEQYSFLK